MQQYLISPIVSITQCVDYQLRIHYHGFSHAHMYFITLLCLMWFDMLSSLYASKFPFYYELYNYNIISCLYLISLDTSSIQ